MEEMEENFLISILFWSQIVWRNFSEKKDEKKDIFWSTICSVLCLVVPVRLLKTNLQF